MHTNKLNPNIGPFQPLHSQKTPFFGNLRKAFLELYIAKNTNAYERFTSKLITEKTTFGSIKSVFKPSDVCIKNFLLTSGRYINIDNINRKYLIEQPGTYKFQVILNNHDLKCEVISNIESIEVEPATGINAKAHSLILQITNHADIMYWPLIRDKTEKIRVEKIFKKIINECEGSVYFKYVCKILAGMYLRNESRSQSDAVAIMKKALNNEKTWLEKQCLYFLVKYYCKQKKLKEAETYSIKTKKLFPDSDEVSSCQILIYNLKQDIEANRSNAKSQ